MQYILVTGGVISGLGKGISTSSVAQLLQLCGLRVTCVKIDPYLNVDPGTMSPYEHGEVFVLNDGGEVDLDLGTYERFLNINLTQDHNITAGKVYQRVIKQERRGDFLGKTVQVVPHVTNAVQEWITAVAQVPVDSSGAVPDVCMIELGGTVGDIEGMVFQEALRQFRVHQRGNFQHIHVSLVPVVGGQKSKPTQHGFRELLGKGLQPDLIFCRCQEPVKDSIKEKISLFCMVPKTHVISMHNVDDTYKIPWILYQQRVHLYILEKLDVAYTLPDPPSALNTDYKQDINVAVVGKYTELQDAYLSICKSFVHSARHNKVNVHIKWIEADYFNPEDVQDCKGLLIPGGFGHRGVAGKLKAIEYARKYNVPFLGICMGFQLAVVEYARNMLNLKAYSEEWAEEDTNSSPVPAAVPGVAAIKYMPDHQSENYGGTMRLGLHEVHLKKDTRVHRIYGMQDVICERHRHRYEVNTDLKLEDGGDLVFSGKDPSGTRMECMELKSHPFFIASQFHPEFLSRQNLPAPLFREFVKAMMK